MSVCEQEEGTYKIPAKEFARVRKAVADAWNLEMGREHALALSLHDRISAWGEGRRAFDWTRAFDDAWNEAVSQGRDPLDASGSRARTHGAMGGPDWTPPDEAKTRVFSSMFEGDDGALRGSPLKPKKKDFPKANTRTFSFRDGG